MSKTLFTTRSLDPIALQWAHAFHGDNPALHAWSQNSNDVAAASARVEALRDWKTELLGVLNANARSAIEIYASRASRSFKEKEIITEVPTLDGYAIADIDSDIGERFDAAVSAALRDYTEVSQVKTALAQLSGVIINRDAPPVLRLVCIDSYVALAASPWCDALGLGELERGAAILYNVGLHAAHVDLRQSAYAALGVLSATWPNPISETPHIQALLPQVVEALTEIIGGRGEAPLRTTAIGVLGMLYAGGFTECSDELLNALREVLKQGDDEKIIPAAAKLFILAAQDRFAPQ